MNFLQPSNAVFLAGLILFYGIRAVFAKGTKAEPKALSRFDVQEKVLLAVMFPPTLLLPVLYLFTPVLAFADYQLPPVVAWCGGVVMLGSLWLFYRSHADLGRNWSVSLELREGHELVTGGVYKYVRHPMYSAIWLWGLAQGMLLQNWLAGWSLLPAFALMYFLRTPREEALMCELFGEEYRDYMRRTGRIFPRLGATPSSKAPPAD